MPSVTCMDWFHWWYIHIAHVAFSSMALASLTDMNDKCKLSSSNTIKVKNQQKSISIEDKLDIMSWLENGEQIGDTWHNVRLAHNIHTVCDNADRINKSAKSGTKGLV